MVDYKVNMNCGSKLDGNIYMSSVDLNGLFRYEVKNKKLEYISPFAEEEPSYALYNKSFSFKSEIWFVPQHGNKIAIYDSNRGDLEYLELQYNSRHELPIDKLPIMSLASGRIDDSRIFILPAGIDTAMVIDMDSREINIFSDIVCENEYVSAGVFHNNSIYGFTGDGKWRIEIITDTESVRRFKWDFGRVMDIVWSENLRKYVLSLYDENYLLICDEEFKDVQRVGYKDDEPDVKYRGRIFMAGDTIFTMPWLSTVAEEIRTAEMRSEIIDLGELVNNPQCVEKVEADNLIGISQTGNILLTWDANDAEWKCDRLVADLLDIKLKAQKAGVNFNNLFWSDDMRVIKEGVIGLKGFLELI